MHRSRNVILGQKVIHYISVTNDKIRKDTSQQTKNHHQRSIQTYNKMKSTNFNDKEEPICFYFFRTTVLLLVLLVKALTTLPPIEGRPLE